MVTNVIIPFYRKNKTEFECLISIISALDKLNAVARINLVDDNPTKLTETDFLEKIATKQKINLHANLHNLGFVKSVNKHFSHDHEFNLIINSDVVLRNFALDEAIDFCRSDDSIATLTAISNSAAIFSALPQLNGFSNWFRNYKKLEWSNDYFDLPTAIGHCFLLKTQCLTRPTLFKTEFSPGYGEETELSLYLTSRGYKHVISTLLTSFHFGSLSFADTKAGHQQKGLDLVRGLFPNYDNMVKDYISNSNFLAENSTHILQDMVKRNKKTSVIKNKLEIGVTSGHLRLKGVVGSFPLFLNRHSNIDCWCHFLECLGFKDEIAKVRDYYHGYCWI